MKEMGRSRKWSQQVKRDRKSSYEFDSDEMPDDKLLNGGRYGDSDDYSNDNSYGDDDKEEDGNIVSDDDEEEGNYGSHDTSEEEDGEDEEGDEEGEGWKHNEEQKNAEMEVLENEYRKLQHKDQNLLNNLISHKDEDILKGEAVKSQKALWDKTLELRFLLQKAFSNSNRLPQEPIKSSFSDYGDEVSEAYSGLIVSSKKTLDSILELQEALLVKNPSITQSTDGSEVLEPSFQSNGKSDEEWSQIAQMHSRMASFRDKSIDKWQRRTQVTTGAAAVKGKLHAFNQSISQQVANYMRDPSKMIKGMQLNSSAVALFGTVPDLTVTQEGIDADGNSELLDDSDFYQQLLKEFFETIDPTSSEKAFYTLKRLQTKKRKIVDRRASKSRKIRYNVHEKIVNFMAPQPGDLPPMAPKLFENLFGIRTQKHAAAEVY